jgi:hypothetical protein
MSDARTVWSSGGGARNAPETHGEHRAAPSMRRELLGYGSSRRHRWQNDALLLIDAVTMRIRIVRALPIRDVDGIALDCFQLGSEYTVGNSIGALFLAEGWAEPLALEARVGTVPFSETDPSVGRILDTKDPPNLIREASPPFLESLATAADYQFRRTPRRR